MSERSSGHQQSISGLFGALVVVLVLVAAVWGLSLTHGRPSVRPAEAIDYSADLAEAGRQAPFAVLAPADTPSGWVATSARWSGAGPEVSWHLGFRTDDGEYVGLEQGNQSPSSFVAARTVADQPVEPATIAGRTWSTLISGDGDEHALVLLGEGVTTVVTGTAPEEDLIAFAASLRATD